jgi:hypothetical protein
VDLTLGRFSAQVQSVYQLESVRSVTTGKMIHESDWSGKVAYTDGPDTASLGTSIHVKADESQDEQTILFSASKQLPIYLNVGGAFEYSAKKGALRTYTFSVGFAQKPAACWTLNFNYTKDANGINAAGFNFAILLGGNQSVGM